MTISIDELTTTFDPPLVKPNPIGVYQHVNWEQNGDPFRFLMGQGVVFRPHNYGGEDAFGVWDVPWCVNPDDRTSDEEVALKTGTRPAISGIPFAPQTVYGFDQNQCGDLSDASINEVRTRAAHNLNLLEQIAAEHVLAERMAADLTGSPDPAYDINEALGLLEDALAKTGTLGFIHAAPKWASAEFGLVLGTAPGPFKTPLGNTWVFGGGYVDTLGDVLVATSQIFGWRGTARLQEAVQHQTNSFVAVVERSVLLGYEKLVAAVQVDTSVGIS